MASELVWVPDIGDFDAVDIIEVFVQPGDTVEAEAPLVLLESDKATMEVPCPRAGVIDAVYVKVGDAVAQGDRLVSLQAETQADGEAEADAGAEADADQDAVAGSGEPPSVTTARPEPAAAAAGDDRYDVVVLGAGPGGYTAAFRAADLGLRTLLVERWPQLGGVCLNVGCIPSKALLHTAHIIDHAAAMEEHGVVFGTPSIELDKLRAFKQSVVGKLTGGLAGLAKQRGVTVVQGEGRFSGPHSLTVSGEAGERVFEFAHAIIAAGSESTRLPGMPYDDPRLMDSTGALELAEIPGRMLVIGGGIIGLEMANVYAVLGSAVDVVELTDGLIPGCDRDLVRPLHKRMQKRLDNIWLGVRVESVEAQGEGLRVTFSGDGAPEARSYARVLLAVGRQPNGARIGAEAAGVTVDERGFIPTDAQMRTNQPHIFAIGDIAGQPMLAHKATHEGKVAAEVIAGHKAAFDPRCIPSVVYTDPEVGWVGLTEEEARAQGIDFDKGQFPWAANGRSLGMGNSEGFTKILFERDSGRCIGAGAVGPNAGELMAELGLAIEFGADAHDIGMTIHAHPTLSESVGMAAEAAAGTLTDLYLPKR